MGKFISALRVQLILASAKQQRSGFWNATDPATLEAPVHWSGANEALGLIVFAVIVQPPCI